MVWDPALGVPARAEAVPDRPRGFCSLQPFCDFCEFVIDVSDQSSGKHRGLVFYTFVSASIGPEYKFDCKIIRCEC